MIESEHVHLKFSRILMTILGIWPVKVKGYKKTLYDLYFYISFTYYILYNISGGAKAFMMLNSNFTAAAINLNVTIMYVLNIYKIIIFRSQQFTTLIRQIEEKEQLILNCFDEKLKTIYRKHVRQANISAGIYVTLGSCGISLYFISPLVLNYQAEKAAVDSDEEVVKMLIFSSWFPFDEQQHYWAAYIIQWLGGFYGYSYITYGGAALFSILIFCVGQLKVLQYIFRNFETYVGYIEKDRGVTNTIAQRIMVKACIMEHQKMIRFVQTMDISIRTFMLLDFLISSFQLSLVVFQIIQNTTLNIQAVAACSYLATLTTQLLITYWNAHEIIIQSSGIADAVFESNWKDCIEYVKKCFVFVILRAQKPLSMKIGPLYDMRMDTVVSIFKAIYSYLCLILRRV